jgi:hypothetical protein
MYDYQKEKPRVLTDEGQRLVCEALLDAQHLAKGNGLIPDEMLSRRIGAPDSFFAAAVIDRLIEMGYLGIVHDIGARQGWIYRWIARSRS